MQGCSCTQASAGIRTVTQIEELQFGPIFAHDALAALARRYSACRKHRGAKLLVQHEGKYQGSNNRSIGVDDKARCVDIDLEPGDLFAGNRSRVGTVGGC